MTTVGDVLVYAFIILATAVIALLFLFGLFLWAWQAIGDYIRSKRSRRKKR